MRLGRQAWIFQLLAALALPGSLFEMQISGLIPELLNQNPNFKIPRGCDAQ